MLNKEQPFVFQKTAFYESLFILVLWLVVDVFIATNFDNFKVYGIEYDYTISAFMAGDMSKPFGGIMISLVSIEYSFALCTFHFVTSALDNNLEPPARYKIQKLKTTMMLLAIVISVLMAALNEFDLHYWHITHSSFAFLSFLGLVVQAFLISCILQFLQEQGVIINYLCLISILKWSLCGMFLVTCTLIGVREFKGIDEITLVISCLEYVFVIVSYLIIGLGNMAMSGESTKEIPDVEEFYLSISGFILYLRKRKRELNNYTAAVGSMSENEVQIA